MLNLKLRQKIVNEWYLRSCFHENSNDIANKYNINRSTIYRLVHVDKIKPNFRAVNLV